MVARIPAVVPFSLFLFYIVIIFVCGILLYGVITMWSHFTIRKNLTAYIKRTPIADTNGKNAAAFFGVAFDGKRATLAQTIHAVYQSKLAFAETDTPK